MHLINVIIFYPICNFKLLSAHFAQVTSIKVLFILVPSHRTEFAIRYCLFSLSEIKKLHKSELNLAICLARLHLPPLLHLFILLFNYLSMLCGLVLGSGYLNSPPTSTPLFPSTLWAIMSQPAQNQENLMSHYKSRPATALTHPLLCS